MINFYLWSGIGAIEDLEEVTTQAEAIAVLEGKPGGADYSLWVRRAYRAVMLGVKLADGRVFKFREDGGG
jgi:hypothetical protein